MSYTPLKTINGQSIKGTGDLTVTGTGVSDGDKGDITVSGSGTVWNIDAATVGVTELSATGTPSATTFLRGDNTWSTPTSSDPAGWTTIVKSANQDTLSSTLSDVTDFSFSVVAGGIYMIQMESVYGCASSGTDIGYAFNVTSGNFTGKIQTQRIQTTTTTLTLSEPAVVATSAVLLTSGRNNDLAIPHPFTITASISCSANATFKVQHRAGTNNFTVRTYKGSILRYKKIN